MDNIILYPMSHALTIYLELNVPTALLAIIAIGGSIILRAQIGRPYKMVSWLSLISAMCLVLNQLFSFILNGVGWSPVPVILTMFFQNIFPPLLWSLLFSIIHVAAYPRLQFHDSVKKMNAVPTIVLFIYLWTGIVIVFNIVFAMIGGISIAGDTFDEGIIITFQALTTVLPAFVYCITFFTMMHKGNHYQDIRSFKNSFITVLILSVITFLGSLVFFAVSCVPYMNSDQDMILYIAYTIMVRICGAIALCIIVFMFPQVWLQGLREYSILNETDESNLFPEDDDLPDQKWNSDHLYNLQSRQGCIDFDGPQNTINHKKS
ncbi:hypothetical protein BDC45DRAFT_604819 [Circinella umbellata]|nr:hypothetical protein BDC45DRAFT_604819 [Circinella umbellata]